MAFGLVLAGFAVVDAWPRRQSGWLAALLAFTIFFYVVIYTMWLKRSTPQNIVIGGAAGALPPIVGYAAATGHIDVAPLVLFAIIFIWTPPHFWALALARTDDYGNAGMPMMPNVKGADHTRLEILHLQPDSRRRSASLPYALGFASPVYGVFRSGARALNSFAARSASSACAKARRPTRPQWASSGSRSSISSCFSPRLLIERVDLRHRS